MPFSAVIPRIEADALIRENPLWQPLFGRFRVEQPLGASALSCAFSVTEAEGGSGGLLVLSRHLWQGRELGHWRHLVLHAARMQAQGWLTPLEVGDTLPWVLYPLGPGCSTLAQPEAHLGTMNESDGLKMGQALAQALALAHEAQIPHGDLQPWMAVQTPDGTLLAGMGLAYDYAHSVRWAMSPQSQLVDPLLRATFQRDTQQLALLMYGVLSGEPALDDGDLYRAWRRLPPQGSTFLQPPRKDRMSAETRQVLARALHHRVDQRFVSSRGLVRAVDTVVQTQAEQDPQVLQTLMSRAATYGLLPGNPDTFPRLQRLSSLRQCPSHDLVMVLLADIGLACELVRVSNSALRHGGALGVNDAVLSLHRILGMRGLRGIARIARALEQSPRSLNDEQMALMTQQFMLVRKAARLAQILSPAGYDTETVYIIGLLQNLGRLMVVAHLPQDASQIHHHIRQTLKTLTQDSGASLPPVLTLAQQACTSVLGLDFDTISRATLRQWGLGPEVQALANAIGSDQAARQEPTGDHHLLRLTASLANEAVYLHTLGSPMLEIWLPQLLAAYRPGLALTLTDLRKGLATVMDTSGGDLPLVPTQLRSDLWIGQEIQEDLLEMWRPDGQ
ncbi:HDOD domain-containing protein [Amphibiibacter pelophylacis]|uniref:HDOD domain-containing protein n=1 Tax=Amphibiibacter pelophylacis TaxID=1799477 RepID=A0ACC6P2V1_9BURK